MPGFPRDLAVLGPWELSLIRSREWVWREVRGRADETDSTVSRAVDLVS